MRADGEFRLQLGRAERLGMKGKLRASILKERIAKGSRGKEGHRRGGIWKPLSLPLRFR